MILDDAYFDRFYTPKYRSKNPVQRHLIRRFASVIHGWVDEMRDVQRVLEIGVGEGFLSGGLSERYPNIEFSGIDLSEDDIRRAREHFPRLSAEVGTIYDLSALRGPFDLVICCEVLEHLQHPQAGLRQIASLKSKHAILSVPHEPWFMLSNLARGKNITRFGNDPEHVNHWGRRSFRRFVESALRVEDSETAYPWVMVRATAKN